MPKKLGPAEPDNQDFSDRMVSRSGRTTIDLRERPKYTSVMTIRNPRLLTVSEVAAFFGTVAVAIHLVGRI